MKLIFRKRILLALFACCSVFAYRWVSFHIWFAPSNFKILINGSPHPMSGDYFPGRSLNGDIFLRNQDHGTQYLISVKSRAVSIISEQEDFIDVGFLTYTHDALANFGNQQIRTEVPNANMLVGDKFVEFSSPKGERWHVLW